MSALRDRMIRDMTLRGFSRPVATFNVVGLDAVDLLAEQAMRSGRRMGLGIGCLADGDQRVAGLRLPLLQKRFQPFRRVAGPHELGELVALGLGPEHDVEEIEERLAERDLSKVRQKAADEKAAGYWEMLRARKPEPLIALGAWTEAGWIALERCSIQCALERRAGELVTRGTPSFIPGDSPAIANWREFTVPWIRNDIHDRDLGILEHHDFL